MSEDRLQQQDMGNSELPPVTVNILCREATIFAEIESIYPEPALFGVTDGKAIGTYLEHKFKAHLSRTYKYTEGNSAQGIDFPEIGVDVKVTSIVQPQSSCPYKTGRQKIFGLGYSLLIFVYSKPDDADTRSGTLQMKHVVFVQKERTADYQMTTGLQKILDNDGNSDDIIAYVQDQNLPISDIELHAIAEELIATRKLLTGYLTISNALQWRLQYGRVITHSGLVDGIIKIA